MSVCFGSWHLDRTRTVLWFAASDNQLPDRVWDPYCSVASLCLLVVPLVAALTALVEETHRFVGGSDLDLDKVRFLMVAQRTGSGGPIDVFPRRRSTQYVVDGLAGQSRDGHVGCLDCARIRTCGAHPRLLRLGLLRSPTVVAAVAGGGGGGSVDGSHLKEGAVARAEPHHDGWLAG